MSDWHAPDGVCGSEQGGDALVGKVGAVLAMLALAFAVMLHHGSFGMTGMQPQGMSSGAQGSSSSQISAMEQAMSADAIDHRLDKTKVHQGTACLQMPPGCADGSMCQATGVVTSPGWLPALPLLTDEKSPEPVGTPVGVDRGAKLPPMDPSLLSVLRI